MPGFLHAQKKREEVHIHHICFFLGQDRKEIDDPKRKQTTKMYDCSCFVERNGPVNTTRLVHQKAARFDS